MSNSWQQTGSTGSGQGCPPDGHPADQPGANPDTCQDWDSSDPPKRDKPNDCPPVDKTKCKCPPGPKSDTTCFDQLIADQATKQALGEKAKDFKADLVAFLGKAKAAMQDYTRDRYNDLLTRWEQEDHRICDALRIMECNVPCWTCILDCYICPVLNDLHNTEKWLCGDGSICTSDKSLYDVYYWYQRDFDRKSRRFDRIKAILGAWEKPYATLDKALADNGKLLDGVSSAQAVKQIYDLLLRIVPMHLAIAPPASVKATCIDKRFTEICTCDAGDPKWCCGIDFGKPSFRQRLIGPQPYLIDPNDYFKLICCIVEKRYAKAKEDLAAADAALQEKKNLLDTLQAQIDDGIKNFEKNVKAALPSAIDCCDYKPDEGSSATATAR